MRITAIVFSVIWVILGLIVSLQGIGSSIGFLAFGGAITLFSALTGLFLVLKKDAAAESCVLGAGILSIPIGLVLIFIVKAATKKPKTAE